MPDQEPKENEELFSELRELEKKNLIQEKQISLLKHAIDSQRIDFAEKQRRLLENARQLYTLLRVSTNVSRAENLEHQLNFIAHGIVDSNLTQRVVISLIDEHWNRHPVAFAGFTVDEHEVIRKAKQLPREKWLQLISSQYRVGYSSYFIPGESPIASEIYNVSDLYEDSNAFMGGDFLVMPLRDSEKQLIGTIISNQDAAGKRPGDAALHLLEIFARDAASAIERHFMHRQLIYDETLLQQLLKCSTDIIVTTDPEGRIQLLNKGAEQILGYRANELIGKSVMLLYRKHDEARRIMRVMWRGSGIIKDYEVEAKTKSGDTIPILLSASLIYGPNDEELGTLGIATNLTELKKLDTHLKNCQATRIDRRTLSELAYRFSEPLQGIRLTLDRIAQKAEKCSKDRDMDDVKADLETVKELFAKINELTKDFSPSNLMEMNNTETDEDITFSREYRILIIDDDDIVRDGLMSLCSRSGMLPHAAASAEEAFELFTNNEYDIIITDIVLPGEDGFAIYRRVKELNPRIPVILITGYGYDPTHTIIRAARDRNTKIYFREKPVDPQKLLKAFKEALEE